MKKYIVELSIIVLGVTIALVFENLNESWTNNKKLETTLVSLDSEIEMHKNTLLESTKNQEMVLEKYFDQHDSTAVFFQN